MASKKDDGQIESLGAAFGEEAFAETAIKSGKTAAEFKDALLDRLAAERKKTASPAWPITFRLSEPREVFGEVHVSLTLREPTASDLIKFGVFDDQLNGEQLLEMIAVLSGQTSATIRALPGVEMLKLSRKLLGFFLQAAQ